MREIPVGEVLPHGVAAKAGPLGAVLVEILCMGAGADVVQARRERREPGDCQTSSAPRPPRVGGRPQPPQGDGVGGNAEGEQVAITGGETDVAAAPGKGEGGGLGRGPHRQGDDDTVEIFSARRAP